MGFDHAPLVVVVVVVVLELVRVAVVVSVDAEALLGVPLIRLVFDPLSPVGRRQIAVVAHLAAWV